MSWSPNDLVSDADLKAYESDILTNFGQDTWFDKRKKAMDDWLFHILAARGFDPYTFRTRYDPTVAFGFTGAAYTDITAATQDTTVDDIDLAAILATPATDAIYLGSVAPFKGVYLRLADSPSATTSTMTVSYWNGTWTDVSIEDRTIATTGVTLSQGGSVTWSLPPDWVRRVLNASARLYWARIQVSATPAGTTAGQMATIRASLLRGAATFRTLFLIFSEAPTGQEGPWEEKAARYETQADLAIQRALPLIGGEFDLDDTDQVSADETGNTAEEAGGGGHLLERA